MVDCFTESDLFFSTVFLFDESQEITKKKTTQM